MEPDLLGKRSPAIYHGSLELNGPLEFQIPVQEADESSAAFRGRSRDEEERFRHQMNRRAPLMIERDGRKVEWDMEELLIFLNALGDNWTCPRGARANEDESGYYTCTFYPMPRPDPTFGKINVEPCVRVRYPIPHQDTEMKRRLPRRDDRRPEVSVSMAWVMAGQALAPEDPDEHGEGHLQHIWSPVRIETEMSDRDLRNRPRLSAREVYIAHFEGQFPERESSSWISSNELLLIHGKDDFSRAMRKLVRGFPKEYIREPESIVARLHDALEVTRTKDGKDHSARAFLSVPGWLCLRLGEAKRYDRRERYIHNGNERAILSGYWVHGKAPSIFTNGNQIDGLIMDTTFTVLRLFYTAILVAVSHNVGIPVALSFGTHETVELYDSFYTAFSSLGIDLRQYILESDQGAALKAVGQRHPRHLFCLHHTLKSLDKKCGRFAPLIGNLLRVRSHEELGLLMRLYTPDFANVYQGGGAPDDLPQLERCLKKVGLAMQGGKLSYAGNSPDRWNQVAMIGRIGTGMPSTSNTIESLNGHLNEVTPRKNAFWGSLHRLAEMFTKKIGTFQSCWRHNFRYEVQKARRRFRFIPHERMTREITFFQTEADRCLCGETVLGCRMFGQDIPCSHRIAHWHHDSRVPRERNGGRTPPESRSLWPHVVPLSCHDHWASCHLTVEDFQGPSVAAPHDAHALEVDRLVRRIARDAKVTLANREDDIRTFVQANLVESDGFALGESASFWTVHQLALIHIRRLTRQRQ
jgi:hypothetical protein